MMENDEWPEPVRRDQVAVVVEHGPKDYVDKQDNVYLGPRPTTVRV